jgi:DnaJ-class molecular chaperone
MENSETRPSEISNLYERLGISSTSNEDEIKSAYRASALKWHPDKFQSEEDKEISHLEFIALSEAYEVLSEQNKRSAYNSTGEYSSYRSEKSEEERQKEDEEFNHYWEMFRDIFKGTDLEYIYQFIDRDVQTKLLMRQFFGGGFKF